MSVTLCDYSVIQVGHYLNAQESLEEFLRQDQLSNHLLLCHLLRAVGNLLTGTDCNIQNLDASKILKAIESC